ncbi:hypothetical protein [Flavobacterium humi]|uniref:YcxB family protein n=1 Tax=Flavobacterium humi TaxID=2562683 RepID=A0A4Z0L2V9_9FLAO|nr:hypothetical protein [Flavobacterium humi]TGD56557.1 hypothetical protein E4635_15350 [Flavobacterium humi]
MILHFSNDEKDYLTYQLYISSKSPQIKKRRWKNRNLIPIFYLAMAVYFLLTEHYVAAGFFIFFAVIWYFIYPIREKKRYIKYYEAFNKEYFSERFGRPISLEITDDTLITADGSSETKVATTEIEAINEISPLMFIKLKTGSSYIVPKAKIENVDAARTRLMVLASHLGIPYNREEDWQWK